MTISREKTKIIGSDTKKKKKKQKVDENKKEKKMWDESKNTSEYEWVSQLNWFLNIAYHPLPE